MPELVDREVAFNDLFPYLRAIRASMLTAWRRWEDLPPEARVDLSPGSRATIVHDLTVAEAAKQVSGVSIHNLDKLKVFLIGLYALRFKKLDERKRSCNQRTNQVDNFRNQRELPGIQSICNIEAGYVLDPFGMSISGFHLVCPNGSGKPYWDVELRETQETAIITDLFDHSGREDADSPPASYRKKNAGIILPFSRREKNDQDP